MAEKDKTATSSSSQSQGSSAAVGRARDAEQSARGQEGSKLHLLAAIRKTIETVGSDATAKMINEIAEEVELKL